MVLDVFNDYTDLVMMTNIAKTATILQCLVEINFDDGADDRELSLVGSSASTDGEETFVTLTNRDCLEPRMVLVFLEGTDPETVEG